MVTGGSPAGTVCPPGEAVTVYPVIGEPPSDRRRDVDVDLAVAGRCR